MLSYCGDITIYRNDTQREIITSKRVIFVTGKCSLEIKDVTLLSKEEIKVAVVEA